MAIRKNDTIPQQNMYNSTSRYFFFNYPPTKLFDSLSGECIVSTLQKSTVKDIFKILEKQLLEIALNLGVFKGEGAI